MAHGGIGGFANVPASSTDAVIVAPGAGLSVVVMGVYGGVGATPSTLTFNSKGSGAGTPISALFQPAASGAFSLHPNDYGWFQTKPGEALTVTTSAGSTTSVNVLYRVQ